MPTQDELDEAVVAAAGALSQSLNLLSEAQTRRVNYKAETDRFQALLDAAKQDVRTHRNTVKTDAVALNAAVTAANAGPTP